MSSSTPEAAAEYIRRNWSVVPVPHRSKNPGIPKWQDLRIAESELERYFDGRPQNIGVLLGAPSAGLVDVDLDHQRAVELADEYLPATGSIFGRAGKPRSHRLYRVEQDLATQKFRSKAEGMIVEIRSTGGQTIFPPSTHVEGEPIEWDHDGEPGTVEADGLIESVTQLADRVREELGEGPTVPNAPQRASHDRSRQVELPVDLCRARCLEAMLRIRLVDRNDGSHRLYAAACRTVEHDLDDADAISVLQDYARIQPFPRSWTDEEILKRVRDAERRCRRGAALLAANDHDGLVVLGTREPQSGRLVVSRNRTVPTAEAFVREHYTHPEGRTIHYYAGLLMVWNGNQYEDVEDAEIKRDLQGWLHEALRYRENRKTREMDLVPFDSNPASVSAVFDTLKNHVHLPAATSPPAWLSGNGDVPADELLCCRTRMLHLPTMRYLETTPALFTTSALEFDPDLGAGPPTAWLDFLHQLFDDDLQQQETLQEWFGYCLTSDTSQQKMLLMVGPRRSGKGTIARVLRQLVGRDNVCGPTTASLAGNFGLQPLVGRSLAIVSDARFSGSNIATVVERLLCVSGEDAISIDRKFRAAVTVKLATRFMFLSNELPRLGDASGALAGRFIVLRLVRSFYGKEDALLTERLVAELPAILNWALEGWRRLRERGHFLMPESMQDVVQQIEDLSSPVSAFVRDRCVVGRGHRIPAANLYDAWRAWCEEEGRTAVSNRQTFGRDLAAAFPEVGVRRGTGNLRFYDGIAMGSEQ